MLKELHLLGNSATKILAHYRRPQLISNNVLYSFKAYRKILDNRRILYKLSFPQTELKALL